MEVSTTDKKTYTSAFNKSKGATFRISIKEYEEEDSEVQIQTKEDYDALPVRLSLVSTAEELPSTQHVAEDASNLRIAVTAGRDLRNHPDDKIIETPVTLQVVVDGEVVGEDTITLVG